MIRDNFIKKKLFSGEKVIGTWATIPSVVTIDIICSSGIDFVIIDSEHGPIDPKIAQEMIITCDSRNVSPLVRCGGLDASEILKFLDVGAHGIQMPNIETAKDVEVFVDYAKYPPIGNRGFSPFTRAGNYIPDNILEHTKKQNEDLILGINIEGKNAITNIDSILENKNIDLFFIGLFDLSKSLGVPGDVNNPLVLNELEKIIKKINSKGKFVGTIATNEQNISMCLNLGIDFLLYHVDSSVLKKAYLSAVNKFKNL